jgi:hypothetical protein
MTMRSLRLTILFLVAVLLAPVSPTRAATPRDEVLRLVPDDVAFCLVVQDLRDQARTLGDSPFARSLRESLLWKALEGTEEFQRLRRFEGMLKKQFGLDWSDLRDDFLGDAFALAYRPGPPGKPELEEGLILIRARDEKRLADFVDRLNRTQTASGDVKELQERKHAGAVYVRRVERDGESFYYRRGPLLAYSSQETILKQAVERDRKETADEPRVTRELRGLGTEGALASLWVNPRAFDAEMAHNFEQARGNEAAFQKNFLRYWKALDSAVVSLRLEKDVRMTLALRARTEDLPPAARRFLAEASKPSDLMTAFPDDAMLAVAGRLDFAALLEMLDEFMTKEARAAFHDALEHNLGAPSGKDFIKELLPALGPDCGLCLIAPPTAEKSWFPQTILATRLRTGPKGESVDSDILSTVTFYAQLAVVTHNQKNKNPLSLKTLVQDKVEIKYLSGDGVFPAGLRPSFALKDGHLVLASSPEVLARFHSAKPARTADDVPLLRLSAPELRRFLSERREPLLEAAIASNGLTKVEAARRLDALTAILSLLDRVEITHRSEAGKAALTIRVQTTQPLK